MASAVFPYKSKPKPKEEKDEPTFPKREYKFILSEKMIDYLNTRTGVKLEVLEGTTRGGKSTIGIVKFMLMVSESDKDQHLIAGRTTGVIIKNLIKSQNGMLKVFPQAKLYAKGSAGQPLPHVVFEGKIIYLLGYKNKDKWENVLGSQFGEVFVDEGNIADIDFIREVSTRNDHWTITLNPDDPNLPIYKEFINRCRPFKKYEKDVPKEIMEDLLNEKPEDRFRYWFFSFRDNLSMSEEKIQEVIKSAPPGTKLYKNKILGLRGRATGLVFPNFDKKKNILSREEIKSKIASGEFNVRLATCGVDTSYSDKSDDSTAFIYQLITWDGKCIIADEYVFNNRDLNTPMSVSDVAATFPQFLDRCEKEWGYYCKAVFVDNADAGTIGEMRKWKRTHPAFLPQIVESYKKVTILDRIKMMLSWMYTGDYIVCEDCVEHIKELQIYSWDEKKVNVPEDRNDHTINASQYGWIPYRDKIGNVKFDDDEEE